ncbi:hypothetical protein [Corynebacterium halotolerans]|uniref:hypothetical protein n=1 Tax=Corynebacterium halotolerans TaxID=225326 RepID=UPI003CE86622
MGEERAGIFTDPSSGKWVWEGNQLFDQLGTMIAEVRTDVIYVGQERLLVEYSPGPFRFRARATSANGDVFTLSQAGYTVNKLEADCAGRRYVLERISMWRKERRIRTAGGKQAAVVRPMVSGKVEVSDDPADEQLPTVDAVFLTWGCVLVDSPVRRPRLA